MFGDRMSARDPRRRCRRGVASYVRVGSPTAPSMGWRSPYARVGAITIAALAVACGGSEDDERSKSPGSSDPNGAAACVSTREFFTSQVFGRALATCQSCHTPGGVADQKGAKFEIYNATWPDFVTANIDAMRAYAKFEVEGKPLLLLKPLGQVGHGGGAVLKEDSEEYAILSKFVNDLRTGAETSCDVDAQLAVELLDHRELARKAAIVLAGRYPTDEEFSTVGTDEGLDAFLLSLMNEELFYDVLREIWNDALLTERPLDAGIGAAFANAPELYDDKNPAYTPDNRRLTTTSVTQEPMRFVEFVVRNGLPFSDVVSGNYVVANPFTAKLYGLPHEKPPVADNFLAWTRIDRAPVQNIVRDGKTSTTTHPMAGILTTPSFLYRWETTPTNKSRKRARIVLKNFLATDIFKFAQRPVDSTELTSIQNPTSNSPMCSVCHAVVDPVAGGFRGFNENVLAWFDADDKWHDDMLPPGIDGAQMPAGDYGRAITWLGSQLPLDHRFGLAVARVMYQGIVGDEPLIYPEDASAPDYEDAVRAYTIQNDWFVKIGADFQASNFDLRKLTLAVVKSPYFAAKRGDPGKDALHAGLGSGRLLTPEMLGRKYRATTGLYFFLYDAASNDPTRARDGYLRNDLAVDRDWRLVYGGIDSGDVVKRTDTQSPIMAATSQYTASTVACRSTTYDFTKPASGRRLFKAVELDTTPFVLRAKADETQVPAPDSEAKIRRAIQDLYFRLLGETVDADSEEVTATYGLFVDVWKDLEKRSLESNGQGKGLSNYRCVAENDWDKGVQSFDPNDKGAIVPTYAKLAARPANTPYQPGMRLDRDETFTIRSWQAVMTYLLTDYRFTHE